MSLLETGRWVPEWWVPEWRVPERRVSEQWCPGRWVSERWVPGRWVPGEGCLNGECPDGRCPDGGLSGRGNWMSRPDSGARMVGVRAVRAVRTALFSQLDGGAGEGTTVRRSDLDGETAASKQKPVPLHDPQPEPESPGTITRT